MINRDMYNGVTEVTACDTLYSISNLAQVGVAASNSSLDLMDMQSALSELFELIYEVAGQGIELAERSERKIPQIKGQTKTNEAAA